MLSKGILVLTALTSSLCFAEDFHLLDLNAMNFDSFVAPVVPTTTGLSNVAVGQIVFDSSANAFKGLDSSGNWDPMTVPAGNVVISSDSERIERVSFGGTTENTNACTSGSCTIYRKTSGVSSVTWTATGKYTISFTAGSFSAPPTCTCSNKALAGVTWCSQGISAPTSSTTYFVALDSAGAYINSAMEIICIGPR